MTALGLDVGGTFLKKVLYDDGNVSEHSTDRLPPGGVLAHVAQTAERLIATAPITSVGVGLAGLVRWPQGEFAWGPHMPDGPVAFRTELERRLGLPVVVDNDANLAAYCEARLGAARHEHSVLMLMFGTGIGAGIVVAGEIYRGRSFAGEVGHMTLQPDGDMCACGRRGCWETLVSGEVLDRRASELVAHAPDGMLARLADASDAVDASLLTRAAESGDAAARSVLADAGAWMGRGVANLILVLDPSVVVIGGAVARAGRWLLDPARTAIASNMSGSTHRPPTPLVEAHHGAYAGAVGAALLAAPLGAADGTVIPGRDDPTERPAERKNGAEEQR